MPSSYRLIFRVAFGHAYFADGVLRPLRIVPVAACYDRLRRAGVLLLEEEGGIAAFGDDRVVERLRLHTLEAGGVLDLAFLVFFTDPHFFEYSLPARPPGHLLFLSTADAVADDGGRLLLHPTPAVPESAMLPRAHPRLQAILGTRVLAPAPAMVLEVALTPAMLDATEAGQRSFQVRFDAASSRWKYCVSGAAGADSESRAGIVDLAGDMEFEHLPGAEIADRRRADVLLSRRAIPMRERPEARVQLRAASPGGDKVRIKRMPNAGVGKRFRESRDGSEILVSEVLVNP